MKKDNKLAKLTTFVLLITIIAISLVSGTFAKYVSTASGSSTATVAKWSFKFNGSEIATTNTPNTITFNLFETINTTGNTSAETNVASGKIGPGTAGSFKMDVHNTSEVKAKYTIALSEDNTKNIPLQYSVDGTNWYDSISELLVAATTLKDQELVMDDGTDGSGTDEASHTIYWRWVFAGTGVADGTTATDDAHQAQTDVTDTALGIAAREEAQTVTITATITAEQVD